MRYLVKFRQPVLYQPDHPIAKREVVELPVHAGSPREAEIHTFRVCGGPIEIAEIVLCEETIGLPPAVEWVKEALAQSIQV